MSLKPKPKKTATKKKMKSPLADVSGTTGLRKGKIQGKLMIWEGKAKQSEWRKDFAIAFYPIEMEFSGGDGYAKFRNAALSNVGGELKVTLSKFGADYGPADKSGKRNRISEHKYLSLDVRATSPYGIGGSISLDNTPTNRKILEKKYLQYIGMARRIKSVEDVMRVVRKAEKEQKKNRGR